MLLYTFSFYELISGIMSLALDAISVVLALLIARIAMKDGMETVGYRFTINSSKRSFRYFFGIAVVIAIIMGIESLVDILAGAEVMFIIPLSLV